VTVPDSSSTVLRVTDLHKTFDSPTGPIHVLNGIDVVLHRGEFMAITGESGSGKSTLLHVVGTLEPADSGDAVLNGRQLFGLKPKQTAEIRNREIGFVYQAHHLIPELDALENVMLPLLVRGESKSVAKAKAEDLLTRLGLKARFFHRPGRLSGGEAQRVAVARALSGEPGLLLADEPTGNLDEHTAGEVFAEMRQLCKQEGAAVMMVTHSSHLARHCDRMLHLHNGVLEEAGAGKS
jgi:lipoprotein-releasing system ATP-binding protein